MAAAARNASRPARAPDLELKARRTPPVQPEPSRPLPYPEPVGINDNANDVAERRRAPQGRLGLASRLARIAIAPLYAVVAAGSFGVIGLFAKSLLGL